ncbi:MAG: DUF3060 domain-containing protein [Mycobacterium sp.]
MRTPLTAVFVAALLLAGCGSSGDEAGSAEAANTINYDSFGTRTTLDCGSGKALDVGGSNNTLTVTGTCASVRIRGADNTITLARVDGQLTVAGLNNTVTYKAGDPGVDDAGSGNRISRS